MGDGKVQMKKKNQVGFVVKIGDPVSQLVKFGNFLSLHQSVLTAGRSSMRFQSGLLQSTQVTREQ